MKIHVLGTGHAGVIDEYNTCFAIENTGYFLVDAGGGNRILKQLKLSKIDINEIEYGFISHNHTDHILGFVWVLRLVMQNYLKGFRTKNFTIYGSAECLDALMTMTRLTAGKKWCDKLFGTLIHFEEVKDGQHKKIVGLDVTFFDTLAKDMPQMAFYIKEESFYFCGDVPLDESYYKKFKNAKWLCLEAFCIEKERMKDELPLKKHKTVKEAGEVAQILNAENLILWHSADNHHKVKKEYIKEAKSVFSGKVIVPKDLDVLEI